MGRPIIWKVPNDMYGMLYFGNSLSLVLTIFWFKHFHVLLVPREGPELTAQHPLMAFPTLITFDLL